MTKIEIAKFLAFYVSSTPSPNRARRAKTFKNIHLKVLAKFRCRIAVTFEVYNWYLWCQSPTTDLIRQCELASSHSLYLEKDSIKAHKSSPI